VTSALTRPQQPIRGRRSVLDRICGVSKPSIMHRDR